MRSCSPSCRCFLTWSTVFRSSPRVSFPRVALWKLRLLLALLFFVHGFWRPGPWLFLFLHGHVARVSTNLQCNQPTIYTLGQKARVVHDHCKRRCCGHRISNKLNTLDVKGSQYPPLRRALCFRKHKLHLVTRIVDIHTLAFMCMGVPTFSNLLYTVFYSHSLNSSAPARLGVGIPNSSINLIRRSPSKSRQSRLPSHVSGTHTGPS